LWWVYVQLDGVIIEAKMLSLIWPPCIKACTLVVPITAQEAKGNKSMKKDKEEIIKLPLALLLK
jgi:hypothetical protein